MQITSMPLRISAAGAVLMLAITLNGCGKDAAPQDTQIPAPSENQASTPVEVPEEEKESWKEFISLEGDISIRATDFWQEDAGLREDAVLSLYNEDYASYLMILSDSKSDLPEDETLKSYLESAADQAFGGVGPRTVGETEEVQVSGRTGWKFSVSGPVNDLSVTYRYLVIEDERAYIQAVVWSLTDQVNKNLEYYDTILESITISKVMP